MARLLNASLFVQEFDSVTPGEYTFTSAPFSNQTDTAGEGTAAVREGFLLYVPAMDVNTAFPIPGVVHRYRLTEVTIIDGQTLSGTILWDEPGDEIDTPSNGVYCLLSEPTPNLRLGYPPSDQVYTELPAGSTVAAMLADVKNIVDLLDYKGKETATLDFLVTDWTDNGDGTSSMTLTHTLNAETLIIDVWERVNGTFVKVPLYPKQVNNTSIKMDIVSSQKFAGQVTIAVTEVPLTAII